MVRADTNVLIVEDNPFIAETMGDMVHKLGYAVVGPMLNLNDALDRVKLPNLHFALLDFDLGHGTDATPIAEALTARGVPFVFTTGTNPRVIHALFKLAKVIAKPVGSSDLAGVLPD